MSKRANKEGGGEFSIICFNPIINICEIRHHEAMIQIRNSNRKFKEKCNKLGKSHKSQWKK